MGLEEMCGSLWVSGPILRAMEDAGNLDSGPFHLVHGYVRQRWECEFSSALYPATGTARVGKLCQPAATIVDGPCNAPCYLRIVLLDPGANAFEVISSSRRPSDLHQG